MSESSADRFELQILHEQLRWMKSRLELSELKIGFIRREQLAKLKRIFEKISKAFTHSKKAWEDRGGFKRFVVTSLYDDFMCNGIIAAGP